MSVRLQGTRDSYRMKPRNEQKLYNSSVAFNLRNLVKIKRRGGIAQLVEWSLGQAPMTLFAQPQ
jgi:hypothetical protein